VARFYFHLRDELDVRDEEGQELPGVEAAIKYAQICARAEVVEILKETGRVVLNERLDIEDDRGCIVDTVWFRDVVRIDD
jgi:hypothetical protein